MRRIAASKPKPKRPTKSKPINRVRPRPAESGSTSEPDKTGITITAHFSFGAILVLCLLLVAGLNGHPTLAALTSGWTAVSEFLREHPAGILNVLPVKFWRGH